MELQLRPNRKGWTIEELEGWDTRRTASVEDGQTRSNTMEEVFANRAKKREELRRELDTRRLLTYLEENTDRSGRQNTDHALFETKTVFRSTDSLRAQTARGNIDYPLRSFKVKWLLDQRPDILIRKSMKEIRYFEKAARERISVVHPTKPSPAFITGERPELFEEEIKVLILMLIFIIQSARETPSVGQYEVGNYAVLKPKLTKNIKIPKIRFSSVNPPKKIYDPKDNYATFYPKVHKEEVRGVPFSKQTSR